MKYFGVFIYGFGFLLSVIFVVWGTLRVFSPGRAILFDQFFVGKRKFARLSEQYSQSNRMSWVVVGILQVLFGLLFMFLMLRPLILHGGR